MCGICNLMWRLHPIRRHIFISTVGPAAVLIPGLIFRTRFNHSQCFSEVHGRHRNDARTLDLHDGGQEVLRLALVGWLVAERGGGVDVADGHALAHPDTVLASMDGDPAAELRQYACGGVHVVDDGLM